MRRPLPAYMVELAKRMKEHKESLKKAKKKVGNRCRNIRTGGGYVRMHCPSKKCKSITIYVIPRKRFYNHYGGNRYCDECGELTVPKFAFTYNKFKQRSKRR